jgi:hypothetical protein
MSRTPIPATLANEVTDRWGTACLCCGVQTVARHDGSDRSLEIDHVVPESWSGPTVALNLQPLCRRCNSVKADRHSVDFRPWGDDEDSRMAVDDFAVRVPEHRYRLSDYTFGGDTCLCDDVLRWAHGSPEGVVGCGW